MNFRSPFGHLAITVAIAASVHQAHGQKTVVTSSGSIFRYHGDTIWVERDTTLRRTIFRGDTVTRLMMMNDRPRGTDVYVLRGDEVVWVEHRDSLGQTTQLPAAMQFLSSSIATSDLRLLEAELRMSDLRSRVPGMPDPTRLLAEPDSGRTYRASDSRAIVHHRDTVRIVRGCPMGGHLDTTVYVVFALDSARRLSPPARTFGAPMAHALLGDISTVLLEEMVASRATALPSDIPRVGNGCGGLRR